MQAESSESDDNSPALFVRSVSDDNSVHASASGAADRQVADGATGSSLRKLPNLFDYGTTSDNDVTHTNSTVAGPHNSEFVAARHTADTATGRGVTTVAAFFAGTSASSVTVASCRAIFFFIAVSWVVHIRQESLSNVDEVPAPHL